MTERVHSSELDPRTRAEIQETADREMASRALSAMAIYLPVGVIAGVGMPIGRDHPGWVVTFLGVVTAVLAWRIWMFKRGWDHYSRDPRRWRGLFGASALAVGAALSATVCASIVAYGLSWSSVLSMLCCGLVAFGGIIVFSSSLWLSLSFAGVSLVPPLIMAIWAWQEQTPAVAFSFALILAFAMYQARIQHLQLWRALESNALLTFREATAARLATALENAADAVEISDSGGTIEYVNSAMERLTGYSRAELVGRHRSILQIRDGPSGHRPPPDPGTWAGRVIARRKDGTSFHADEVISPVRDDEGVILHYVTIKRDVGQRLLSEQALAQSRRDLQQVIEHHPDGVAIVREGLLVYANPRLAEALALPPETLRGKAIRDLVAPGDGAAACAHELAAGETPFVRASGGVVVLEVSEGQRIQYEGGPATLYVARDVTTRRQMQARLLLADRMASVGALAAGIAHEINNPLAYVVANLHVIGQRLSSPLAELSAAEREDIAAAVHDAQEGAQRVAHIVQQLRPFSDDREDVRAPVDVVDSLESALRLTGNQIRHRTRLVRRFDPCSAVLCSEGRLIQVFVNLIINALESFEQQNPDANELTLACADVAGGRVSVSVEDNGRGIPRVLGEKIFEPFFTTKPSGIGTGLGLSVCHSIVTDLGGELRIDPRDEGGTRVTVTLPAAPTGVVAPPAKEPTPQAAAGPLRILVLDDEASVGQAIERMLSEHQVRATTDPNEALQLWGASELDLFLCDLMMPGISGMEIYRRVAPADRERLAFITGGAFTREARCFLEETDRPCLSKPFTGDDLRSFVAEHSRPRPPA